MGGFGPHGSHGSGSALGNTIETAELSDGAVTAAKLSGSACERLIASVQVNAATATAQTLYTVPSNYFYPTMVLISNASTDLSAIGCFVGFNSTADEAISTVTPGLTDSTGYYVWRWDTANAPRGSAGDVFKIRITSNTAGTMTVHVFGITVA